jgi:protein-tyrosine phosphatase
MMVENSFAIMRQRAGAVVLNESSSIVQTEFSNFRDLGGLPAGADRYFRPGVIFRTQALTSPSADTSKALAALGLTNLVDLRMDHERLRLPVELPFDVTYVIADVAGELSGDGAAAAGAAMNVAADLNRDFIAPIAPTGGKEMMMETYRKFVEAPSARAGYSVYVRSIIETDGATAVFCAAGKDRTGWAAAFLQSFIGVEDSLVMSAYTDSNEKLVKRYEQATQEVRRSGGDIDAFLALINSDPDYLDAAFAHVKLKYGDLEGYLIEGLGLSPQELIALERRLVS